MICVLCHFEIPLDDTAIDLKRDNKVICLRCVERESGAPLRVPVALRREIKREGD